MEKKTKKEFIKKYRKHEFMLVQFFYGVNKEQVEKMILDYNKPIVGIKTTNVSLDNCGEHTQIKTYRKEIKGHFYWFVEEFIDNSKDSFTSREGMEVNVGLYVEK